MNKNKYSTLGLEMLLVLFIAFKLSGIIAWSWWWVLAPLWIPVAIMLVVSVYTFVKIYRHEVGKKKRGGYEEN